MDDYTLNITRELTRELTLAGFTLHKDFHFTSEGALIASDSVFAWLSNELPPSDRKILRNVSAHLPPMKTDLNTIEFLIGCENFFHQKLPEKIKERCLPYLRAGDFRWIAMYLIQLTIGLEEKFPSLKEDQLLTFLVTLTFGDEMRDKIFQAGTTLHINDPNRVHRLNPVEFIGTIVVDLACILLGKEIKDVTERRDGQIRLSNEALQAVSRCWTSTRFF